MGGLVAEVPDARLGLQSPGAGDFSLKSLLAWVAAWQAEGKGLKLGLGHGQGIMEEMF